MWSQVVGRNWNGLPDNPCRVKRIPSPIPARQWYLQPAVIALMGGLLPFGSIFIEMYFIFTSFWNYKARAIPLLPCLSTASHLPVIDAGKPVMESSSGLLRAHPYRDSCAQEGCWQGQLDCGGDKSNDCVSTSSPLMCWLCAVLFCEEHK